MASLITDTRSRRSDRSDTTRGLITSHINLAAAAGGVKIVWRLRASTPPGMAGTPEEEEED